MTPRCCRCGCRGPDSVPEPEVVEGDDEVEVRVAVPANFFPTDDVGPELTCAACATDDEINQWLLTEAGRRL